MAKVMLLDDSPEIQLLIQRLLNEHEVICATTIEEAQAQVDSSIDLYMIDLNLPDGYGLSFVSYLDSVQPGVSKLIFSGNDNIDDRIMGFQLGADDYLTKPIDARELKVRLEARLKKVSPRVQTVLGPLSINQNTREVRVNGEVIDTTPYEYSILTAFLDNQERILNRQQLINMAWGVNEFVTDRVVDMHISNLRKKLGPAGPMIRTVYGSGYIFELKNAA